MKYALFGYTYQHYVASLLLAIMDVERVIDHIRLEADVDHKFDDIALSLGEDKYFLQIKDIEGITIDDLKFSTDCISINGKKHKLSNDINLVFFKGIKLKNNCKILNFVAQKVSDVYLVSISREQIETHIAKLYKSDLHRRQVVNHFFSKKLDERVLEIDKKQLPSVTTFDTQLVEKTIKLARKVMDFEDILHIEGKPGVGKSHLVSFLQQQFKDNVLYRFWISNQDRQYEDRLKYSSFKTDLIKKIFFDLKERSEDEILERLTEDKSTLIIDGLDHVENYRNQDLHSFIDFINRAKACCKVIVLSRPLRIGIDWKKQTLRNWNGGQTKKILKNLYYIEDYLAYEQIYKLTDGYPILVKYIAEQYKKKGEVPVFSTLDTVNGYYDQLFKDESGKRALTLFLCCRGFIMRSEIKMFLGEYTGDMIKEFIDERPYLFEQKLNRISLYHDSLITYLRSSGLDFRSLLTEVNTILVKSLVKGESRFQSRIGHFDIPLESKIKVIRWYSSIQNFRKVMRDVIDFEAIHEFYEQIRELLCTIAPENLNVREYYDLALIFNLTSRDHFSTMNGFYFTYVTLLLKQGFTEEYITSSKYLFGMLLYIKNQDGSFLHDVKNDGLYDTKRFYEELDDEIEEERSFFEYQSRPFRKSSIEKILANPLNTGYTKNLESILVNVYQHKSQQERFGTLIDAVKLFLAGEESKAAKILKVTLYNTGWEDYRFLWSLKEVKAMLFALGIEPERNDYLNLSLDEYLKKHKEKGSFTLWPELLSYLRLAIHENRMIDINSISAYWTKYHQRKDYSLLSLDHALTLFEEKGYIDWTDSVKLLQEIQETSEKGYRGILASYFMLHEPAFILDVLSKFDPKSLRIEWFLLKTEYINILPNYVYNLEINEQLYYHRHNQEIEIRNIRNLLGSNKLEQLKTDLDFRRYIVTLPVGDPSISLLKLHNIRYKELKDDRSYRDNKTGEDRLREGILDYENMNLIKENGLTPTQVALLADGNYTTLAEPEIFRVFEKKLLQDQMKAVLYSALTGRSYFSDYFHVPWLLPGNMLKLISDSGIPVDFKDLFGSFIIYLELSMWSLKTKTIK